MINVAVVTQNWNKIGSNVDVFTLVLLSSIWVTKMSALSIAVVFHKNSLIVAWYLFRSVKTRTLTSSNSKYQTNDIFKLFGHNCNHQRGFLKQKVAALHRCSFNLKLPKNFYFDFEWNSDNWKLANIEPNDYLSALGKNFHFTQHLTLFQYFTRKSPNCSLLYPGHILF